MFYATSQECCQTYFQTSNCPTYERTCSTNVLTMLVDEQPHQQDDNDNTGDDSNNNVALPKEDEGDCITPGWHPDSQHQNGCTNSNTYPTQWNSIAQRHKLFFNTYEECCSSSYFLGGSLECFKYHDAGCTVDDTLPTCDSNEWHYYYNNGEEGCINTPVVGGQKGIELFDSARECCDKLLLSSNGGNGGGGQQCSVMDGCTNDITYLKATKHPTMRPTDRRTEKVRRNDDMMRREWRGEWCYCCHFVCVVLRCLSLI